MQFVRHSSLLQLRLAIGNMKMLTPREIGEAKKAHGLYKALGTPSINNFRGIIRSSMIKGCPVTLKHIKTVEMIFGPDIGALKGKTTRKKPIPVVKDYMHIPVELTEKAKDIELCTNTLFIDELPFLATVARRLQYLSLIHI